MAGLGNLIQKAKAMIPKVVSAGKQAVKTVVNKVADSAIGKAVKAVPQALRAGIEKRVEFTKKVAASVPKAIESVKKKAEETAGKVKAKAEEVKAKAEEVKESVTKKITDINQRNERILDKVKVEWEKTSSGLIRGFTTTGAICPTVWQVRSSSLMLDFMLQTRKAVIEEYPIFNRQSSFLKDLIHTIETGVSDGGAKAGSFIYNLNLPGVSDFVGAFTGQREPDAMSSTFSMRGAFCRGLLVDGLLGTVDGVANLIADPFEAMEGLNTIMLYPEVTLPAIGNGIKTYFKEKILDGSPDDWAQASGQVTFEVISFLAGVGEAKTGTKAAKAAKAVKAGEIVEDSSQMTRTVLKLMDKAADSGKAAKYLNVPALKNLGKKVLKNLDDLVVNTGKRTGDFIDNVRMGMNRLSGPVPEYAGVGQLDDIGRTGEKIEDLLSAFKNKFMKAEKPPESGVGIFTKTNEEKVGKLIDNLPDKSAAKGAGDDVVTYRRVQGGEGTTPNQSSQPRVKVNENGSVSIQDKKADLNVSIDNGEHSKYFNEVKRGGTGEIVEFDMPKWFDDFLKENTIPQNNYTKNPLNQSGTAPKLVDPNMPGNAFELPTPWTEWIEEYAKNARVKSP